MARKRNARGQFVSTRHQKRRTTHRRRKNPETRAARSRASKLGWRRRKRHNPESRAKRSRAAKRGWSHRRHVHHGRRRTYRRNPSGGSILRAFKSAMLPAVIFPAAALLNDAAHGFVPLPATMKTGFWAPVTKLLTACALGAVGAMVLPREEARLAIGGMLGGVAYDAGKTYLGNTFPSLALNGFADFPPMTYETSGNVLGEAPMTSDPGNVLGAFLPDEPTGETSIHGMGVYLSNE